jgi:hypothetical protein
MTGSCFIGHLGQKLRRAGKKTSAVRKGQSRDEWFEIVLMELYVEIKPIHNVINIQTAELR